MKDSAAVVAGAAAAAVADSVAAEEAGDSVAVRRVEDFPVAGGPLPAQVAAEVALRVAGAVALPEAAASTAGHRSVLPVADVRVAASRVLAPGYNPGRALEWELASGPRSVQQERDPGLVSDSYRPEAHDPGSAPVGRDPELVPDSYRPGARDPVPASASDRVVSGPGLRPASGQPLCRVWEAERVWGVEIESRTCRRRVEIAPPACRIAWRAAIA